LVESTGVAKQVGSLGEVPVDGVATAARLFGHALVGDSIPPLLDE
jgi:hypothetical protein